MGDLLETLEEIESVIQEVLPETTENYTIGSYDDLPAIPYVLPPPNKYIKDISNNCFV